MKITRTNEISKEERQYTFKRKVEGKRNRIEVTETYIRHFEWMDITFEGETRRVKAYFTPREEQNEAMRQYPTRYNTEAIFASRTRHGSKLHRENVTFEFKDDGRVSMYNSVALNRQAMIVGWWKPEYDAPTGHGSKHIGG
jgi:hypothetical protein